MKLGQIWNELFDAYYCGWRLRRIGVTPCRRYTYDYDSVAIQAWIAWTKR